MRVSESLRFDVALDIGVPCKMCEWLAVRAARTEMNDVGYAGCLCGIENKLALHEHVNAIPRQQKQSVDIFHRTRHARHIVKIEMNGADAAGF